jgi:uncharacterized damage-inducible protein DinB
MDRYELALDILTQNLRVVRDIIEATPKGALDEKPATNAWSIRDVLTHMAHIETAVIPRRVRAMVASDGTELPATPPVPAARGVEEMLAEWEAARAGNLEYLRGLTAEQLQRTGIHRQYGRITAREHIIEWAYHDLDHLRQMHAALQSALYDGIGGFQALYPRPS